MPRSTAARPKSRSTARSGLQRHGHRPIVFAATGPAAPELKAAGVEVICLGQSDLLGNASRVAAAVQGTWNFAAADALGSLLAGLPQDRTIVHAHGWAKALSPAIGLPIRASGLPSIYTIHDYFMFCPNGGFYNFSQGQICHLTPLSAQCWMTHCDSRNYPYKLWRNARLEIARKIAGLPEAFSDYIALSGFQRGIVEQWLPRAAKLHIVGNPIDAEDLGQKADSGLWRCHFRRTDFEREGAFAVCQGGAGAGHDADIRRRRPARWRTQGGLSRSVHSRLAEARGGARGDARRARACLSIVLV